MATLSNNDIARALYLSSKEDQDFASKAVSFLNRRRLLGKSAAIIKSLERIINAELGVMEVKATVAQKLDDKTKLDLVHILKHKYKVKEVKIVERIDENVLGGMKLEMNDEVLDLTLKNKIRKLSAHLTNE